MRKKGVSPVGTGVNTDKEALLPRMTAAKKREGGEDGAETRLVNWRNLPYRRFTGKFTGE